MQRPLWVCPRCDHQFVNRNQWHSCGRHRLDDLFARKPAHVRDLFDCVRAVVETCGPVKILPYRDKVGFMVRVRFAAVFPKRDRIDVGFWLPRRIDHPRFYKVETLTPTVHLYTLRVTEPGQIDRQLARWLKAAYAVGCQKHLKAD